MYDKVDHATFEEELTGRKIVAARRRGKQACSAAFSARGQPHTEPYRQLWFETDGKLHPGFHFGMTGSFVVKGQAPSSYKRYLQACTPSSLFPDCAPSRTRADSPSMTPNGRRGSPSARSSL